MTSLDQPPKPKDASSLETPVENQLIWLVYGGNQDYIDEAVFSILSAIYKCESNLPTLRVITDTPELFPSLPVVFNKINKETLKEWYGPDNYNHRSKPKSILSVLDEAEKSILIDSDTFFKKDPNELFKLIDSKTVLVDAIHEKWKESRCNKLYNSCGSDIEKNYGADDNLRYVNSGLIGVSKNHGKIIIKKMIEIIDRIYVKSGKIFSIEQFALGVSCYNLKINIVEHNNVIEHYWGRKTIHRSIIQTWLKDFQGSYFSEKAEQEFFNMEVSPPRPSTIWRLFFKAKSLSAPREYRQFCIEVNRACHNYKNTYYNKAQNSFIQKALSNLNEKYPTAYADLVLKNNITIVKRGLTQKSIKKLERTLKNVKN